MAINLSKSLNSLRTTATVDQGLWWTNMDLVISSEMEIGIWYKGNVPLLGSVNCLVIL